MESSAALTDEDFDVFRQMIKQSAGIHLSDSKRALVSSRLAKRVRQLRLPDYTAYRNHLAALPAKHAEWQEMINAITTNKTEFFRENHHFEFLRDRLLPQIERQANQNGRRIRIWSAGCSTGEEPYTLAMTLCDYFGKRYGWDIRILASDVDTEVLAHAEKGVYSEFAMASIPERLRKRYFQTGKGSAKGTYRVSDELRDLITFRRINFNDRPWPIHAKFDFIFCRNVLIYFDRVKQEEYIRGFLEKLIPNGHLFLGHSENVMGHLPELSALGATVYQFRDARSTTARTTPMPHIPRLAPQKSPQATLPRVTLGEPAQTLSATVRDALVLCLHDSEQQRTAIVQWPLTTPAKAAEKFIKPAVMQLIQQLGSTGTPTALIGKAICVAGQGQASSAVDRLTPLQAVLETAGIPCATRHLESLSGVRMSVECGTGRIRFAPCSTPDEASEVRAASEVTTAGC